ncbi:hypothetical protein Sa4125_19100 [Aureimonas sp. SA4125]|uniref:hypothetical protein n=1 Tax=Aureimonas sp. SA4125 TaxID=2826993 RepID=UPI001CC748E0|nr:hypothetical protein [Aureimonas sp. SA4125]BDA84368.1 hypothetical protein Sa4125_19100 [Aureimonas sp. SA4125]
MSSDETPAVKAAQAYFRNTEMRAEKGTAMSMIAVAADATQAKNERLKAARLARDETDRVALEAEPKPKPVKKRKAKPTVE